MIPLSLNLKNFLSYGPATQTVDFGPHQFICLSGKNGHGKSALLDAITWAVWGQARKMGGQSRSDDFLLHIGQSGMMVCFEFMCNGATYRIRREFSNTKSRTTSTLDFGILDPLKNQFVALSEKTIRATQEKIIRTIGISYDSFTSSAFIRQGASAEFSKKSPKERKEIIADLLMLGMYEELKKKSIEHHKELLIQKQLVTAQLTQTTNSIERMQQLELHHAQIVDQATKLEQEETACTQQLAQIHVTLCNLLQESARLESAPTQSAELAAQYAKQLVQIKECSKQYQALEHNRHTQLSLSQLSELLASEEKKLECTNTLKSSAIAIKTTLDARKAQLLESAQKQLASIAALKESSIARCAQLSSSLEHTDAEKQKKIKQITELTSKITTMAILPHERCRLEHTFQRTKEWYQRMSMRGQNIKKQYELLKAESCTISALQATCPQCQQQIPDKQKKRLCSRLARTKHRLEHQMSKLATRTHTIKTMLTLQHAQLVQSEGIEQLCTLLETTRAELHSLELKNTELNKQIAISHDQLSEIAEQYRTMLQQIDHELYLQADPPYQASLAQSNHIDHEIATINYDQAYHQHLLKSSLAATQIQHKEHIKKTLREQIAQARTTRTLLIQTRSQCERFSELVAQRTHVEHDEQQSKIKLDLLVRSKQELMQHIGSLKEQMSTLEQIITQNKQHTQELERINTDCEDYATLSHLLGKDGIQALLIEEAIPELEAEANDLLARLSDNQSHLSIESLRDLKSGKTKETLDITISDNVGIRPYEFFSGGEAFRIDFALRIALAKLLARRAGTTLQTLIIDEGFGSQDEDGLARIVDALYKIGNDFAKVIVVTHLTSLKNQFPVHFVVNKGPGGSVISVSEN